MEQPLDKLWAVATRPGPVDAMTLLHALTAAQPGFAHADVRSRMLIRDSSSALERYFGSAIFRRHASRLSLNTPLPPVPADAGDVGFPTLEANLVDATDPETLFRFLRELGQRVRTPCSITIGGSLALMVEAILSRRTEDIDVVNELPAALRNEHDVLHELGERYRLKLTHFQSHYLPDGYEHRVHSLGRFGSITAFRVDPLDVLTGKLFSARAKDLDDVRLALPLIDRAAFIDRISRTTDRWRADDRLRESAERNWYILTGDESLPPAIPAI